MNKGTETYQDQFNPWLDGYFIGDDGQPINPNLEQIHAAIAASLSISVMIESLQDGNIMNYCNPEWIGLQRLLKRMSMQPFFMVRCDRLISLNNDLIEATRLEF